MSARRRPSRGCCGCTLVFSLDSMRLPACPPACGHSTRTAHHVRSPCAPRQLPAPHLQQHAADQLSRLQQLGSHLLARQFGEDVAGSGRALGALRAAAAAGQAPRQADESAVRVTPGWSLHLQRLYALARWLHPQHSGCVAGTRQVGSVSAWPVHMEHLVARRAADAPSLPPTPPSPHPRPAMHPWR